MYKYSLITNAKSHRNSWLHYLTNFEIPSFSGGFIIGKLKFFVDRIILIDGISGGRINFIHFLDG